MLKIWWAARSRQRFFTYAGTRQHPKRPRVLVGSFKRRMALSPWILQSKVYVPKSMRPARRIPRVEPLTAIRRYHEATWH
jgi:hypothetical protein